MSNTNSSSAASGGIGFFGLLGLLFIALKLFEVTAVATWPWWLVLLPIWIGPAIFLCILAVIGLLYGILWLGTKVSK